MASNSRCAIVISTPPSRLTQLHTPKPHRQPLLLQAHGQKGASCLALMPSDAASVPVSDGKGGGKEDGGRGGEVPATEVPALQLPLLLTATVVKGFGRGSKLLGIPTANLDMEQVGAVVDTWPNGIYFGFAFLHGHIYKAVASIGTNPYFKNSQKTVEPHLLHDFPDDFYGEDLKFLVCGYVRPEASFPSLDELVTAIHNDIAFARTALEEPEWREFASSKLEWTKTESAA